MFSLETCLFLLRFAGLWNSFLLRVHHCGSLIIFWPKALVSRAPTQVLICFSHQRHWWRFDIFFIRRCGGDSNMIADPISFPSLDDLIFPPIACWPRRIYVGSGGFYYFIVFFGDLSVLSFSLEQTKNFVVDAFAPRWLHYGSSLVFLH